MSGRTVPVKVDSIKQSSAAILKPRDRSHEVTGLGLIACLMIASWSLVDDGTLPLSEFLVLAGFLLVSAGGLMWRILKLTPPREAKSAEPRQPDA